MAMDELMQRAVDRAQLRDSGQHLFPDFDDEALEVG
jgi:hypothetical protein